MKKKNKNTVTFELDTNNMPQLTEVQCAELEILAASTDAQIDYSDIPPIKDTSRFYRPAEEGTTCLDKKHS